MCQGCGMSLELVLRSKWNQPDSRKREAARAAHEQDRGSLLELLEAYLARKSSRKADTSKLTRALYKAGIARWLEFCSGEDVLNPNRVELLRATPDDLETFLVALQERGRHANAQREHGNPRLKPGTVAAYLSSVRALYRALIWASATDRNPAIEVKPPRDPGKREVKGVLTVRQFNQLSRLPDELEDEVRAARDRAIIVLGGSLGLRAREMCSLDVGDLDLAQGAIKVLGKGAQPRRVPLHQGDMAILAAWLESRRGLEVRGKLTSSALLVSFSRAAFGERLHHAGARHVINHYLSRLDARVSGLHVLRRTTGSHLYRATRDLRVVAELLGHESVDTSAVYARLDDDVRREAKDRLAALRRITSSSPRDRPSIGLTNHLSD
jgi:integrase/recombinase XerC